MKNSKSEFLEYLKKRSPETSHKPSSYLNAMKVIEDVLFSSALIESISIWDFVNENNLDSIYSYILNEQKKEKSVFTGYEPASYWKNNYCSAALGEYKKFLLTKVSSIDHKDLKQSNLDQFDLSVKKFIDSLMIAELNISDQFVKRYFTLNLSKPFILLTGLSGSGKTKLAQAFSMWISDSEQQYKIIPVGADWTSREPLLGYPNNLESGKYIKPDNGVLDLLIEAQDKSNLPFFLILDEMNLSHVERYFADFLSAMESKVPIPLHSNDTDLVADDGTIIPSEVSIGDNIFIIGTVNIDETTYMFSPKVLDRAGVLEFRVTEDDLNEFLENPSKPDMDIIAGKGASMAYDFLQKAKTEVTEFNDKEAIASALSLFFSELKKVGAEFGYRTASEIFQYAGKVKLLEEDLTNDSEKWNIGQIIDTAIIQKLLPKLHGSRRKLEPVLKKLMALCLKDSSKLDELLKDEPESDYSENKAVKYPISFEKLLRMYNRLIQDGFTSFAEA